MKIYLAGKIQKNGWRSQLTESHISAFAYDVETFADNFKSIGDMNEQMFLKEGRGDFIFPYDVELLYGHQYSGPILFGCDHGCFHGSNSHGSRNQEENICGDTHSPLNPFKNKGFTFSKYSSESDSLIVFWCLNFICASDAVFVWVEGDFYTAYGTIYEIGYANSRNIPVYIGISESAFQSNWINNLWFCFEENKDNCVVTKEVKDAFSYFFRDKK